MLRSSARRLSVNETVSGEIFNQDWPEHWGSGRERIIHPGCPEFGIANFLRSAIPVRTSTAWASASKPIAIPFRLTRGSVVYQLGWVNGSGTMTDSADIGIYDTGWNQKVSGGGTARSGASAVQWIDVTDTFLQAGKYYVVMSNNGTTTGNTFNMTAAFAVPLLALLGLQDSGTNAYPLPNPLTNMVAAATFTSFPFMYIACRVPF